MISWLKKEGLAYAVSFFLPLLIVGGCYFALGIYWGSERSVLASDSFSQFSNFHASFNNILHGKQNFLYTWNASLGLNYLSFVSYYLGGLFTPLVFFFDNQSIPDALYLLTLLKIGSAGMAFYAFARKQFAMRREIQLAFSTAYALMSFSTAYSELIMWLDAFVWLPLVILGIHRLLDEKKCGLLFVSYFFLFVSNFYFGFMIGIFSGLYFSAQLFVHWSVYRRRAFAYLRTSLFAVISSMILILPLFFDLRENGEKLSKLERIRTEDVNVWSLVLKNFVGVYDTTKYHSLPFVYIGLISLLFGLFFFFSNRIRWREKVAYGGIFSLLIASFYLEWLNLFWQGFHSPNMFLYRYSFLFSFLLITLAGRGISVLRKPEFWKLGAIFFGLFLVFGVTCFYNCAKAKFLTTKEVGFTFFFLGVYFLLFVAQFYWWKKKILFLSRALFFTMSLEAVANTYGEFEGISRDWVYSSRSLYAEPYPEIQKLVQKAKQNEGENRFRLENLAPVSANDGLNYDYSGVSFFSSIRNRHSSGFLNQLGYKSAGTNLNIRYENNTLLMDSLLGIRYNIDKGKFVGKSGFLAESFAGEYRLYKNLNALPLALKTSGRVSKFSTLPTDNLSNQRRLFNTLANVDESYFSFVQPELVEKKNVELVETGETLTYKEQMSNVEKVVEYKVKIPAKSQAYFSFFSTNGNEVGASTATLTVNGASHSSEIGITGQYYNLGNYEEEKEVVFKVSLYGSKSVTVLKPRVLLVNTESFARVVNQLKTQGVAFQGCGRKICGETIAREGEEVLYTTIPYDKGWRAFVNGKEVTIRSMQGAFVSLPLVKGKNKIELSFFPQGLIAGIGLFFLGVIGFLSSEWWVRKRK